jgi:hypothetical protein
LLTARFVSFSMLFAILFFGCRQQLALKANFESDEINALPNTALLGDPVGDQIVYTRESPSAQIKVVQDGANKWMQWANHDRISSRPLSQGARINFRANAINYPTTVSYYWKLKIDEAPVNGAYHFGLTDGSGTTNVHLVIEDAMNPACGSDYSTGCLYLLPEREFLGSLPIGRICEIWVTVNHEANTFSLLATRPTFLGGSLKINTHALSANSTPGSKNPTLELYNYTRPPEFTGTGLGNVNRPAGILNLDDIIINQL